MHALPSRTGLLLAFVTLAACGGSVEDSGATKPSNGSSNAPASTNTGDGCARACDRLKTCGGLDDPRCAVSCSRDFGGQVDAARRYAACLDALTCAEIQRGMTMDYGPIGECQTKARRGP
jgi:hypothetical protein